MVTNFEGYTSPLNDIEKQHLIPFLEWVWNKKAEMEFVNMSTMIKAVNDYCDKKRILNTKGTKLYRTSGPRMRQMIHYLRTSGKVSNLLANSKGYYKSSDPKEIAKFIKSCFERANSFNEVGNAMKSHHKQILEL